MLQEYQQLKISEYQNLYDRLIPESHVLWKFNNLVDFSFVRDELEHKYCLDNGRNAISPVMLFKYLILKRHRLLRKTEPRTRRIERQSRKSIPPHLKAPSHHLEHQAKGRREGIHLQQRCRHVCLPRRPHGNQKGA